MSGRSGCDGRRNLDLNAQIAARLREIASAPGALDSQTGLTRTLHLLAKWRQKLIDGEIIRRDGTAVTDGPFRGLKLLTESAEGCLAPKLLGCYEADLHPAVAAIGDQYDDIIDIGCAEGYYAVGLARRTVRPRIQAHDTNPRAQAACRALAELNGVSERITIGGEFRGEAFEAYRGRRTFLLMDIEGGEDGLLRPDLFPALREMSILVECHDVFRRGLTDEIGGRFAASHDVQRIDARLPSVILPAWFDGTAHLDQLLAVWEWRSGPTPWLVMHPRGG